MRMKITRMIYKYKYEDLCAMLQDDNLHRDIVTISKNRRVRMPIQDNEIIISRYDKNIVVLTMQTYYKVIEEMMRDKTYFSRRFEYIVFAKMHPVSLTSDGYEFKNLSDNEWNTIYYIPQSITEDGVTYEYAYIMPV